MKKALVIAAALVATTAWVGADLAEAKRMGGGRSVGAQRQMAPQAAPTTPSTPSAAPSSSAAGPASNPVMAPGAKAPAAAGAAAAAPAAAGASRWLGPIAGLAAGLGLAALMSHLGLSEAFGSFLLIALLVVGGIFLVRMLMRRNAPTQSPLQYAGNAPGRVEPVMPNGPSRNEPVMGAASGVSAAPAASSGRFPPGFNAVAFAEQAKVQFRNMQAAYDRADRTTLAEIMTPEMFAEVSRELAERGGSHAATEVLRLDAEVLEATTEGRQHWLSVRFTGELREDGSLLPKDFDEVWNLVKPTDDSTGWMLAGIQQTHAMA